MIKNECYNNVFSIKITYGFLATETMEEIGENQHFLG